MARLPLAKPKRAPVDFRAKKSTLELDLVNSTGSSWARPRPFMSRRSGEAQWTRNPRTINLATSSRLQFSELRSRGVRMKRGRRAV